MQQFYAPASSGVARLRIKDGTELIRDPKGIVESRAEHFDELLNKTNEVDLSFLD